MNNKQLNEGLNYIDDDVVEKYIAYKNTLKSKKSHTKEWVAFAATVACVLFIVSTILIKDNFSGNKEKEIPIWNDAKFSAEEISKVNKGTMVDGIATSAYTKVLVKVGNTLNLNEIPDDEYLDILQYKIDSKKLSEFEIDGYLNAIMSKLKQALGKEITGNYSKIRDKEIEKRFRFDGTNFWIRQNVYYTRFILLNVREPIRFMGGKIQIDKTKTNEEIKENMQVIKNQLSYVFNLSFTEIDVAKYYYQDEIDYISVRFYNLDNEDNMTLIFNDFRHPAPDFKDDESILEEVTIYYTKYRGKSVPKFDVIAKARKISLEEAEELLKKGYMFGHHVCSECMKLQDKVDFEDYDYVGFEYITGEEFLNEVYLPSYSLPFYTFYKEIERTDNGDITYAKTYVPAIEIYGCEEYFAKQMDLHKD